MGNAHSSAAGPQRKTKRRQKQKGQTERRNAARKWWGHEGAKVVSIPKWVWKVKSVSNAEECKCIWVLPMRCIVKTDLQLVAKRAGQMGNSMQCNVCLHHHCMTVYIIPLSFWLHWVTLGYIGLQLVAKKAGQMGNARDKLIHRISGSLWPTGAHLIWHQCDTIFSVCGPQPGFWLSSHPLPIRSATKIQFMLEYTNTFKKYTNTMWYNI